MSCNYVWRDDAVWKTFEGFVTGSDFVATAEAVSADRRFDRLQVIYNDLTRITGHSIDEKAYARVAICRLGAMATNPNFRVAFVASAGDAEQLKAAIAPSVRGVPFDPLVFATLPEAEGWFARQGRLDGVRASAWGDLK